jgi:predicted membrane-bound spermidine synthase
MAVEIGLLQIMSIYLGHPLYSMVVVLFSLLLASGIGSWLSHLAGNRIRGDYVLYTLCGLIAVLTLTYPTAFSWSLPQSIQRIVLALAMVVPLGLLMGQAFPLGMQQVHRKDSDIAPWCWAVNGAASVITSVLTMAFALLFGLQAVFGLGLAAYLMAALCYRKMNH